MQHSKLLLAALPALFFTVPAAAATPPCKSEVVRRVAPPSSNPHDVFRRVNRVRKVTVCLPAAKKDCVCPMKGAGATAPATPPAPSSGN